MRQRVSLTCKRTIGEERITHNFSDVRGKDQGKKGKIAERSFPVQVQKQML